MNIKEGHYTVNEIFRTEDCDHGPCTGYRIEEIDLVVYLYDNDPTRISLHEEKTKK